MNILLVDDHQLVAEGISSLLVDEKFKTTHNVTPSIDAVYSVEQAIAHLDGGRMYQLILLDLSMPTLNGFDFLQLLKSRKIETPAIVLSASDNTPDMQKAYNLGARGYISKFEPAEDMLRRIGVVISGGESYPEVFYQQLALSENSLAASETKTKALTKRQIEVLELIAVGRSNKQISQLLDVSEATVKFHIGDIFRQLNVHNRTLCVREAINRGIIEPDLTQPDQRAN